MNEPMIRMAVVSDLHFAGPRERLRRDHETAVIPNPWLKLLVKAFRHYIWMRDPFANNGLLETFITRASTATHVVANGDYSCDTAFVGVSDDAAMESAQLCVGALRNAFGGRLRLTAGDHEFGKKSLFGGAGGLRFASYERTTKGLEIPPVWSERIGGKLVLGVTSTLAALPVLEGEAPSGELALWRQAASEHASDVTEALGGLGDGDRWVLFCHDPTALPFLAELPAVARALERLDVTVIGHLHSPAILGTATRLAGMPSIHFLGTSIMRMSRALRRARAWARFRVELCPSPTGLELLKDGGFLELEWASHGHGPVTIHRHRI